MPRPVSLSSALATAALTVGLLVGPGVGAMVGAASPAAATPSPTDPAETTSPAPVDPEAPGETEAEPDPLQVTIRNITPAALPERGPIRVTGRVTNTSTEPWIGINVHPFMGESPMTTAEEISVAAESDPRLFVGERITAAGSFENIGDLAPGESARFNLRIARSDLPVGGSPSPGVYWFGVHALGASPSGRDGAADGRARTFLPAVAADADPLEAALVLQLRHKLLHTPDGRVADVEGWSRELSDGGRLRRTVDFASKAGSTRLTWLVDPAVLGAVSDLTVGNPPRSLGEEPDQGPNGPTEAPTGEPSDAPTDDPSSTEGPLAGEELDDTETSDTARNGLVWLQQFSSVMAGHEVLALPYGDLDSNAAAEYDAGLSRTARDLSRKAFEALGIPARPAVAPPSGQLSSAAILNTDASDVVLVSDRQLDGEDPAPARIQVNGRDLLVAASGAVAGGPGPDSRTAPTAVRQRILAEAAVRLLAHQEQPEPLVVMMPERWSPRGGGDRFFGGLDQTWLRMVSLGEVAGGGEPQVVDPVALQLDRPSRRSLTAHNVAAAIDLIDAGATLEGLLVDDTTVADQVTGEALSTVSYHNGRTPYVARLSAGAAARWVRDQLGRVSVEAPPYVTLSSDSGRFSISLVNDLEQRVAVRLEAVTESGVSIDAPSSLELDPGGRTSLLVTASSNRIGTHNVEFRLTDLDGNPIGSSTEVPIRSAQVSNLIWFVIAGGGVLLLGAVGVRVWRRLRRRGAIEDSENSENSEVPAGREP